MPRNGLSSSEEICPSCNFQFGFDDLSEGYSDADWRDRWVAEGMQWHGGPDMPPPANWDPEKQLSELLRD
ncbi:hypothetical protein OKHIF_03840 [Mycobacteroides chelonae]